MLRKTFSLVAAGAIIAALAAPAFAADGDGGTTTVTAAVGTETGIQGMRYVSVVTPVVMGNLASVNGAARLNGNVAITVQELLRTGTNPWRVKAQLQADLSDGAGHAIARNKMTMTPTDNDPLSANDALHTLGGGATTKGTPGPLDAQRDVFSNAGQSAAILYTGTYVGTAGVTLDVPNGTTVGVYTGTLVVTLCSC